MIYITGDTHGDFSRIYKSKFNESDMLVIVGDSGINYFDNKHQFTKECKTKLNSLSNKIFAIQGNHEKRATNINTYKEIEFYNGKALAEDEYPNIIFAIDGEIYNLPITDTINKRCIVIGGAYSVDKYYRLERGLNWWEDEQPSEAIKNYVEKQLEDNNWNIDYVISHTCPYDFRPTEWFLPMINQNKVDNSTEYWLQHIYNKISFDKWYCGHFHGDKINSKANIRFLFRDIVKLGEY